MKFIQTFWTKPLIGDEFKLNQNILMYEISSFLIKKYFPEIKLELVTDTLGAELLVKENYDEIKTYFDSKIINDIDISFWAIPKLFALLKYDEDIIHFDGDFFINSKNFIDDFNFDVIVQNKEVGEIFKNVYASQIELVFNILKEPAPLENYAYNCGILGFRNINFKNFYLKKAIFLFYQIAAKFEYIKERLKFTDVEDDRYICCLIEQYLLAVATSEKNIHVKEIITLKDVLNNRQFSFDNKKFIHPVRPSKYSPSLIKYLKLFLKDIKNNSNIEICEYFKDNISFYNEFSSENSQCHNLQIFNSKIIDWLKVGK